MTIPHDDLSLRQPAMEQCWKSIGVMGDGSCPKLETTVHCHNCEVFAAAGQQLFERQPPAGYIHEQTALLAERLASRDAGSLAMLVFRIGEEWLALDVHVVVEVAQPRTIHRVPHRLNRLLTGIVNIRGELQLCVSLRRLLGMVEAPIGPACGSSPQPATCRFLVCEQDGERWAFPVDEVSGVHRIKVGQIENVPTTIAKSSKRLINAVFSCEGESVGRLDKDRLFEALAGGIA